MRNNQDIDPDIKRKLKWKELAIRIEHYKYYLNMALQVTVFFYVITGGVMGFYLKNPDESAKHPLEYILLLPILMGSVLGGIFIYGARLQEKAINSMEHIRDELRGELGLDIKELYDAHLLNILLRIFGYIFFLVGAALIAVPFKLGPSLSSEYRPFAGIASGILIGGATLPLIARWFGNRLKKRRKANWQETATTWLKASESVKDYDIQALKANAFYYEWLPHLSKKTLESIKDGTFKAEFLRQDIEKLKEKENHQETQDNVKFKKIREKIKAWWKWLTDA